MQTTCSTWLSADAAATLLAEAVYAQGRFGEALRLTEEGEALAGTGAGNPDQAAHDQFAHIASHGWPGLAPGSAVDR